jgi:hypothetical protein
VYFEEFEMSRVQISGGNIGRIMHTYVDTRILSRMRSKRSVKFNTRNISVWQSSQMKVRPNVSNFLASTSRVTLGCENMKMGKVKWVSVSLFAPVGC